MPMWRCPHCGTPQAETARCWVCRRSSTACGTCRHFRRSVAAQLGYCGLDRRRQPLAGNEIRACWEAGRPADPTMPTPPINLSSARPSPSVVPAAPTDIGRSPIEFVEVPSGPRVDEGGTTGRRRRRSTAAESMPPTPSVQGGPPVQREPAWSLWGDLDA